VTTNRSFFTDAERSGRAAIVIGDDFFARDARTVG
jgi:hypothetical protein